MRAYPSLLFIGVFLVLLFMQVGVHRIANDALVLLLPSDGCGQILNKHLQDLIKVALGIAYATAILSALSFAKSIAFGRNSNFFVLIAFTSIAAFLIGGTVNLWHAEHLNSCDLFYMGRHAPLLNYATAGLVSLLTLTLYYWIQPKR